MVFFQSKCENGNQMCPLGQWKFSRVIINAGYLLFKFFEIHRKSFCHYRKQSYSEVGRDRNSFRANFLWRRFFVVILVPFFFVTFLYYICTFFFHQVHLSHLAHCLRSEVPIKTVRRKLSKGAASKHRKPKLLM